MLLLLVDVVRTVETSSQSSFIVCVSVIRLSRSLPAHCVCFVSRLHSSPTSSPSLSCPHKLSETPPPITVTNQNVLFLCRIFYCASTRPGAAARAPPPADGLTHRPHRFTSRLPTLALLASSARASWPPRCAARRCTWHPKVSCGCSGGGSESGCE